MLTNKMRGASITGGDRVNSVSRVKVSEEKMT